MSKRAGWLRCKNLPLLVELCELWNKDRLYEILWEYSDLSPSILEERGAKGWIYYEKGRVAGFALGRERLGLWHMEELWGPSEGINGIALPTKTSDKLRAMRFGQLAKKIDRPLLVRAAVDNPFASLVAKELGARWCGGFLLAKKKLRRECVVSIPPNCLLRNFERGDENNMSEIHGRAFDYTHPPEEYEKWATQPNCRTTIALLEGKPVGFLIAEKRAYGRLGDFMIAVDLSNHGSGIGSALIEKGFNDLLQMGVRTAIADFLLLNTKVQALNRKHGFQIVRAYNYYLLNSRSTARRSKLLVD